MNDDEDLLGELGKALGHEPEREPAPERVAAVRAAAARLADDGGSARPGSPRRKFLTGGIAAGIGGLAGYLAHDLGTETPPAAAPVEAVTLDAAEGVSATGGLINHTWGTELLLDVPGSRAGRRTSWTTGSPTEARSRRGRCSVSPAC